MMETSKWIASPTPVEIFENCAQNNQKYLKSTGHISHRSGDRVYLEMVDADTGICKARVIRAASIISHLPLTFSSPYRGQGDALVSVAKRLQSEATADVLSHPSCFRTFAAYYSIRCLETPTSSNGSEFVKDTF
jgi:hypothetical protein